MRRSAARITTARTVRPRPCRLIPFVPSISCIASRPISNSPSDSDLDSIISVGSDQTPPPVLRELPPFKFETGHALFAKRNPRPFPPPFYSPPSGSFSDPLSTHHASRDRRVTVNGQLIRGYTNGDDAVYASDLFIGANDGVGAWSTRPGGHAG